MSYFQKNNKPQKKYTGLNGAIVMGCSPSILSSLSNNNNRKDSGLYCSNNNSDNNSNKIDAHNDTNTSTALANQILIQSSTKDALDKVSGGGVSHVISNPFLILFTIFKCQAGLYEEKGIDRVCRRLHPQFYHHPVYHSESYYR